jgi:hypothetical protein
MPQRFEVTRRDLLRSTLGGLLLAPFLRQRELEAQTSNPKRLVLVFTPDSHPPEWWPSESGSTFQLNEPLADFRGLEQQMLFLRTLDHSWTYGNHHIAGMTQLFTGAKFVDEVTQLADGPSIDQVLLQKSSIRGGTPVPSVHLCVASKGQANPRHILSYSGSGQPIPHVPDPAKAFRRIFNGVTFGSDPIVEQPVADETGKLELDRRLVQIEVSQLKAIQKLLGKSEREKLERHVEGLYELEQRLAVPSDAGADPDGPAEQVVASGGCEKTDVSGYSSSQIDVESITQWARIHANLLVNAFACDRTRVADLSFSYSGGHHAGMLGLDQSWHDMVAHVSKTNDAINLHGKPMSTRSAFIKFDRFWAGHVAYLARRLASIPEGESTMLDNTILLWGVESGTNHSHSPNDMQYLVIGGRNLGVNVGHYINNQTAQSSNKLLVSVMNALGHPATGIGVEPDCGALAGFSV